MTRRNEVRYWQLNHSLDARKGHLRLDGVDLVYLAEQYGTPLYVFSEKRIIENTRELRRSIQTAHSHVKICYASKANSNMTILRTVLDAGGDIEVNSG